jgi:ABC-type spermidine/putrescine transport system permease subunit I
MRYWFPPDGKGPVNTELVEQELLRSGRNPVLGHLFLNHLLDYDVAVENMGWNGYQPPQTRLDPTKLVEQVTVVLGLVYGYIPYMVLALYAGLDRVDQRLLEAARDLGASRRRTFLLVTLPLSRQAILAGLVVTSLPIFGDYFTNDLLSGSPRTSMVGNLVNDAVSSPGRAGRPPRWCWCRWRC